MTGALLDQLLAELELRGFETEVITELSRLPAAVDMYAAQGRLRTVVAAGGDGTAETVANLTPADTPLTLFPLGTENLLAKYLGMFADPEHVAGAIEAGRFIRMDTGQIRVGDDAPRLFLLMTGCGFDAEVIHRLHQARVGNITHLSYAKPILEAIRTYDYPIVKVTCHETPGGPAVRTIMAHWVFVFNIPSYAVGLEICADADPFDGRLDLITFHGGSFLRGLLHLGSIILRRHRQRRSVQTARIECVRISSERYVPIQMDGDPGGALPIEVRVEPKRLTAVVPEEWTNLSSMR